MRSYWHFILFLIVGSCIEPYEFTIRDEAPSLVIEGFISDRSFKETLSYPSDGRYFWIKLSTTSDVTNVRPTPVANATVSLINLSGNEWLYTPSVEEPGIYQLLDSAFKAEQGEKYKIRIAIAEDVYESSFEGLCYNFIPPIGEIGFKETESQKYVVEAGKRVVKTIKEITANISLPTNPTGEPIYYRWTFLPLWIYKAPNSPGKGAPGNTCWAGDVNYIKTYALQEDVTGGYTKDLFSIPTVRNERIFEDLSVLVVQYGICEDNYTFWKDLKDQNESSALVNLPPFNTLTNFKSSNERKVALGYFGVVNEQATRWYFNRKDLSYNVVNTLEADCNVNYGPPLPCPIPGPGACECKYCLDYSFGKTTEVKPNWWRQ